MSARFVRFLEYICSYISSADEVELFVTRVITKTIIPVFTDSCALRIDVPIIGLAFPPFMKFNRGHNPGVLVPQPNFFFHLVYAHPKVCHTCPEKRLIG